MIRQAAMLLVGALVVSTNPHTEALAQNPHQGAPASALTLGTPEDEQAIRHVIAGVLEAANRHDAKAGSLLFTNDADFVNVLGMRWKGSAEIERSWRARFETGLKTAAFRIVDVQISFLKPDIAIAHALTEISGFIDPNGEPVAPHNELSLRVLVKQDGKWLVRAFHNTTVASSIPRGDKR